MGSLGGGHGIPGWARGSHWPSDILITASVVAHGDPDIDRAAGAHVYVDPDLESTADVIDSDDDDNENRPRGPAYVHFCL